MSDLISRRGLIIHLTGKIDRTESASPGTWTDFLAGIKEAIAEIRMQPSVEERTAQLIQCESECGFVYYRCMGCGTEHSRISGEYSEYKYCPECGAKFVDVSKMESTTDKEE